MWYLNFFNVKFFSRETGVEIFKFFTITKLFDNAIGYQLIETIFNIRLYAGNEAIIYTHMSAKKGSHMQASNEKSCICKSNVLI